MGLLDLLFPGSNKKIYRDDFKKSLHKISDLSEEERAYVEEVFSSDLEGGLSKFEIKERCKRLMHKPGDILEPYEVEKIKEKLEKHFG